MRWRGCRFDVVHSGSQNHCLAVANETRADHAKGRFESNSDVMIGSEQIPATGKSFELMRSTLRKRQARTGDKVGHYP